MIRLPDELLAPHSAEAARRRLEAGPPAVPDHLSTAALAAKAVFAAEMAWALEQYRAWDAAGRPA